MQPYVDQAAADKIRAEKEKEAFTVSRLDKRSALDRKLDLLLQSKKEKKEESIGSADEEED